MKHLSQEALAADDPDLVNDARGCAFDLDNFGICDQTFYALN